MKFDIRHNPDYFVEFIKSGETMLKVFNKRQGHMKISVDRANKNALISKFKEDDEVIQITGDTTSDPTTLSSSPPTCSRR